MVNFKRDFFILVLLALPALVSADDAGRWTPFRIGYPVSLRELKSLPRRDIVYGLDIGLPATSAKKVVGFQVGILADTRDEFVGFQIGGAIQAHRMVGIQVGGANSGEKISGMQVGVAGNILDRLDGLQLSLLMNNFDYNRLDRGTFHSDIAGLQVAPIANITTTITGGQVGAFNFSDDTKGFQIGIVNRSKGSIKGVQIGLFNDCADLSGLQVGLVNRVRNRASLKIMPLINVGW